MGIRHWQLVSFYDQHFFPQIMQNIPLKPLFQGCLYMGDSPTPNTQAYLSATQRGKSGGLCCNWQWSAHAPFLLEATYTTPCQLWVILGDGHILDLLITPGPWCAAIARQPGRLESNPTLAPFPGGLAGVILWEKESPFSGRKRSTVAILSLYHFSTLDFFFILGNAFKITIRKISFNSCNKIVPISYVAKVLQFLHTMQHSYCTVHTISKALQSSPFGSWWHRSLVPF